MIIHARTTYPAECCGLLAGIPPAPGLPRLVRSIYPLVNELHSPSEFRSDPRSMFAAQKAMRVQAEAIFAVFHSHPSSAPVPSQKDCANNLSDDIMNLILGLSGPLPDIRAWWIMNGSFAPGDVEII